MVILVAMDNKEYRKNVQHVLDIIGKNPEQLNARLNLEIMDCDAEKRTVNYKYTSKPMDLNPYDGVHGGIITALIDAASAFTAMGLSGNYLTTTDISISFLKAMTGSEFCVYTEITRLGKSLVRSIGKICSMDKKTVYATGISTYMVLDMKIK